ncbi:FKBP-type peptidyl-prolyl cis-trans isomerase [Alcanivorax sp. 1008]|uniref:FKBP-type peptidyl-prolyl cis-trans isomerase n=1 Tax=Alcanivorax sp. 1008 TaxID=2816853 RepID=UPI001DB5EAD9|nr:FKBP-type peptidyl-prolyl cis-trans isomerase [Alcanivorax sp. 1008]MCC1496559.1 FKBP-type peptidyl-prolyl cis-trans isomerase [Alcanivorax sp. 1008]
MTDQLRAGPDTRVTLHFAVRLMDGTEMDSTFSGQPASFVWGDESLLPGFERALLGLKAGDKRSVYIEADKGFGAYNPDNIQQFRQDEFAEGMTLEAGVVVSFRDASGAELPGVISQIEDNWVTVDFNHPLAGRDLTFEVEILTVERDVPEQPVTIRL